MSLFGTALGLGIGGAGAAVQTIANANIQNALKDELAANDSARALSNSTTLQQQQAEVQRDRDARQQDYRLAGASAESSNRINEATAKANIDEDPIRQAARARGVALEVGAKDANTSRVVNPGDIVSRNGEVVAQNNGLTGPQATIAATRMRIAADQEAAKASAAGSGAGQAPVKVTPQTFTNADGTQTTRLVPTAVIPGEPVRSFAVGDESGAPLLKGSASSKPLTESEGKALQFGQRMTTAQSIMSSLEAQGTLSGGRIKEAIANVPGGTGIGNWLSSEDQQKYGQAKQSFILAALRDESGASIGNPEYINYEKAFFPQVNDKPSAIVQKAQARADIVKTMGMKTGGRPMPNPPAQPSTPDAGSGGWSIKRVN